MKYFLTVLSILSLSSGSLWFASVLLDTDRPIRAPYLFLALGPTIVGIAALVGLSWRSAWAPPLRMDSPASPGRVLLTTLAATAGSYVPLAFLFWLLATLAVAYWADPADSEGSIFAALMGLWMPLWWSALPGSIVAWLWLRRKEHDWQ